MLNEITIDTANCRNMVAYIFATLITVGFATLVLLIIVLDPYSDTGNAIFITYSGTYTGMTVVYSFIIMFLVSKLDKLTLDGLTT